MENDEGRIIETRKTQEDPKKTPGVHKDEGGGMNPNTKKKWFFSILYF